MRWFWGLVAILAAFLTWQAASAGVALHSLADAARTGDGATILRYTDLPAVRRSISRQVLDAYARQVPEGAKKSPIERALGSQVGAAVLDAVLAQLVTADNLTTFLRDGAIRPAQQGETPPSADRGLPDLSGALDRIRLTGPLEIAVRVSGAGADYSGIRLRSNVLGWRLAALELPAETLNALVARLRGA